MHDFDGFLVPVHIVGNVHVLDHHALGPSCGSGSIDAVRQVIKPGRSKFRILNSEFCVCLYAVQFFRPERFFQRQNPVSLVLQLPSGNLLPARQQQLAFAILHTEVNPVVRIFRDKGHEGRPRLQHRNLSHIGPDFSLKQHADQLIPARAKLRQHPCQLVAQQVQFLEAQLFSRGDDSRLFGVLLRVLPDLLVYRHEFHRHLCVVESCKLRFVRFRQQAHRADLRFLHQPFGGGEQVLGKPQHPFFRELLISVFQRYVVQPVRREELDGHTSGHHACVILFHERFVAHQQVVVRVPTHPVGKQIALVDEFHVLVHRAGLQHLIKGVYVVCHGVE